MPPNHGPIPSHSPLLWTLYHLSPELLSFVTYNSVCIKQWLPIPCSPSPRPWQPPFYSPSLWSLWDHTLFFVIGLLSLVLLQGSLYSVCQNFLLLQGWIIFCVCMHHIFKSIHLSLDTWFTLTFCLVGIMPLHICFVF